MQVLEEPRIEEKKKQGILENAKMYTSWKKENLPGEIFKQEAISQSKVMALSLAVITCRGGPGQFHKEKPSKGIINPVLSNLLPKHRLVFNISGLFKYFH